MPSVALDGSVMARFQAAASLISTDLLDDGGLDAIGAVACQLPGALSSNYVLEYRLGDAARTADFSFRITEPHGGHHVLAGNWPTAPIAPAWRRHPEWQRIMAFARDWASGATALRGISIWLEFDTAGARADVAVPSIFFQPHPERHTTVSGEAGQPLVRTGAWDAADLEPVLSRWPLPLATKRNIAKSFAALPPVAGIESVGLLLPRVPADVRLTISPLNGPRTRAFLRGVDWGGFGPEFEDFAALWPEFGLLRLNVDVGEAIGPRLGVEFYWNRPPAEFRMSAFWRGLINRLVERGIVRPEKAAALFADRPYVEHGGDSSQAWPADLLAMAELLGATHRSVFWCYPLHLKLSFQAQRPLECKAYFSLTHFWIPRSGAR